MNARVRAVIRKELREYRRNKLVVGTMAAVPLIFLFLPTTSVLSVGATTPPNAIRAAVGSAFLALFLVPLILPTVITGYAVVGEREQGTLEPVLTTPIRREELVIGKALAAVMPSVGIAYGLFAVYLTLVTLFATHVAAKLVWQPSQVIAMVLFTPLLATFSVWIGLGISTRATDIRVAQQLAGLAVIPMAGLLVLFTFRVISPTVGVAVAGAAFLLAIDLGGWRIVSGLFDRERLLTRYGGP